MNLKIGIYGGTFDPIHIGHIKIAETAFNFLQLDKLLFIPSFISPHKSTHKITSAFHRYNMVKLAINHYPQFLVSKIEIERRGTSFTIDTLKTIHKLYKLLPENLFLIIGGDSLADFNAWKEPNNISGLCKIVVAHRPGCDFEHVPANLLQNVLTLPAPLMDISSSKIREKIMAGENVDNMVPQQIIPYLKKHSLFGYSQS